MSQRQHRTSRGTRNAVTVAAAMLAAGALSTGAMAALNADQSDPAPQPRDPSAELAMVTSLPSDQAAAFSILTTPQQKGDDPGTGPKGPFGANLALARKVATTGRAAWLVPANGHVCLRSSDAVGVVWTCTSTARAKAGGLIMTIRPEDPQAPAEAVYAAVPDDAAHLQLTGSDGPQALSAHENIASVTNTSATTLTFDKEGAAQTQQVPR